MPLGAFCARPPIFSAPKTAPNQIGPHLGIPLSRGKPGFQFRSSEVSSGNSTNGSETCFPLRFFARFPILDTLFVLPLLGETASPSRLPRPHPPGSTQVFIMVSQWKPFSSCPFRFPHLRPPTKRPPPAARPSGKSVGQVEAPPWTWPWPPRPRGCRGICSSRRPSPSAGREPSA